jgi:hypothetical protein
MTASEILLITSTISQTYNIVKQKLSKKWNQNAYIAFHHTLVRAHNHIDVVLRAELQHTIGAKHHRHVSRCVGLDASFHI